MKKKPLVSIIINNYNYANFIAEAINSALRQTYQPIEIIVVDDGSTDNSRTIINHFQAAIIPIFKENGGQASAFNAGFAASSGDIICFLDADDIFVPKKVAEVVTTLQNNPELNWCFHDVQLVDQNGKQTLNNSPKNPSFKCDLRASIQQGKITGTAHYFEIPPTSGLCFNRGLLEQILPMPEGKGISIGDSYLQHAALYLSPGFVLGKPLVLQRIHNNNRFTLTKNHQQTQAKIYILLSYWLKHNFPALKKLTDKYIALSLSLIWYYQISDFNQKLFQDYFKSLTIKEKNLIRLRAIYYILRKIFNEFSLNSIIKKNLSERWQN
ncbi:glycosyl transferase family 2 [Stanieria cyanosphaera PCC 7437]|uniref:Glycosyl transferase family 2 n=1 Tax=Stanieria cyanosphaera (strain ATCC 29371 / PCC 7437) TaxID=111780 RepID=K9XTM0_STAC7|nr:glycosyltransferase [Stanieria cyanosphaera]AFZ35409.1 glycosyl transferase family 2 [Stanieria cyanosphaera PCC 7437]